MTKLRKITAVFISIFLIFSLSACGSNEFEKGLIPFDMQFGQSFDDFSSAVRENANKNTDEEYYNKKFDSFVKLSKDADDGFVTDLHWITAPLLLEDEYAVLPWKEIKEWCKNNDKDISSEFLFNKDKKLYEIRFNFSGILQLDKTDYLELSGNLESVFKEKFDAEPEKYDLSGTSFLYWKTDDLLVRIEKYYDEVTGYANLELIIHSFKYDLYS